LQDLFLCRNAVLQTPLEERFRRCVAITYADLNTGPRATAKMMQN
jgi:hypothetical protein